MRTGSELVRATKPFAQEVRWRSWWYFWSTWVVLIGVLTLTTLEVYWPCRLGLSILAGLTVVRMFAIYHDYQHGAILRDSTLARVLFGAYGVLILTPPSIWRHSHQYHHNHHARLQAAGIGSFPVMTTKAFAQASLARRFTYGASRHPLTILAGYATVFLCGMCLFPALAHPRQHADAILALLLHFTLVVLLALFAPALLWWTLLLPLMVATALGAHLFYAQHNFPSARFRQRGELDYVNAALAASSYIPMNPVLRWFTGNIGYHHVHHLNAQIPFYRLPEAMAHIPELQSPGLTTLSPLGIYRCWRLKLWDPDAQRLVSYTGR